VARDKRTRGDFDTNLLQQFFKPSGALITAARDVRPQRVCSGGCLLEFCGIHDALAAGSFTFGVKEWNLALRLTQTLFVAK
jgi:hypothetical protein